ncbi:hypothetical protein BJ912DRAFT_671819 [Pholiota molesta]|nr:hypothetical protein BJ912DRAFT_671819 [Pholiota molesta]
MPAPAVYVLAIVGTVGAVLAFKEFVYEPHIAPAIDRWKLEYRTARDARRRRLAMEVSQDGSDSDLLMSETRKKPNGKPSDKYSDDDDSDDEAHGKGATTGTSHSFMKGGLLIRRSTLVAKSQVDVELDDLVAHEVNQWRNEVPGQVLRQRKNVSEHTMDESIQPIPYAPLSPSRTTHVVFDAAAPTPSPPNSHMRLSSPPPPHIASAPPTGVTPTGLSFQSQSEMTSSPAANPTTRDAELAPSLHSPVFSPELPVVPSPPEVKNFQHIATHSTLLRNTSQLPPTFNEPSTAPTQSLQQSYHQIIPSLSQSYPQDLDYEHDLELLSPPSSRAESPFSFAALSPDQGHSSRTLSGFSSAISSPSPLRMDLGNQSYDAISPHLVTPPDNTSTAHSTQSTAYLSFAEDSSDDGMDGARYARPGADGAPGPARARAHAHAQPPPLRYHQPAVLHPSLLHGPYHTSASPPHTSRLRAFPPHHRRGRSRQVRLRWGAPRGRTGRCRVWGCSRCPRAGCGRLRGRRRRRTR